jgi:hypothetical protein
MDINIEQNSHRAIFITGGDSTLFPAIDVMLISTCDDLNVGI